MATGWNLFNLPHNDPKAAAEYVDQAIVRGTWDDAMIEIIARFQHDQKHLNELFKRLNEVFRNHGLEGIEED